MSNTVLVLNSGSSSIKFGLFDISAVEPTLLCKGLLDEHDAKPRLVVKSPAGEDLFEKRREASDADSDHLFADVLGFIEDRFGDHRLRAVGHRVVHGGPDYSAPVELTDDVTAKLEALTPLAPLHQPRCLAPVRAIKAIRPDLTHIACFDTAFHHGIAPPANRFAIPRRYEERGVRRYGFHGLSFEYVAERLAQIAPQLVAKRTVIAHLGNGASLCGLRDGRSMDTTMGLTPLDGLVMGTRCGRIDPGVLLYLQQHEKMSVEDVQHLLYHRVRPPGRLLHFFGHAHAACEQRSCGTGGGRALHLPRRAGGGGDGDNACRAGLPGLHRRHRRACQGNPQRDR